MKHRLALLLAAVVAALVVVPLALPTPTPTILSGIFRTKISGKGEQLNGTWFFNIHSDTQFTLKKNGKLYVKGTAAGTSGKLAIADTGGPAACKGVQAGGVYKYTLKNNLLTLTATFDQCSGRKTLLTAHPFLKVGNSS
jgi:hypothetical protein